MSKVILSEVIEVSHESIVRRLDNLIDDSKFEELKKFVDLNYAELDYLTAKGEAFFLNFALKKRQKSAMRSCIKSYSHLNTPKLILFSL